MYPHIPLKPYSTLIELFDFISLPVSMYGKVCKPFTLMNEGISINQPTELKLVPQQPQQLRQDVERWALDKSVRVSWYILLKALSSRYKTCWSHFRSLQRFVSWNTEIRSWWLFLYTAFPVFLFRKWPLLVGNHNKQPLHAVWLCTKLCEKTLKMLGWLTPINQQQNLWLSLNQIHSSKLHWGVNFLLHWEISTMELFS